MSILFIYVETKSLCNPDCPKILYVDQVGFELIVLEHSI